MNVSTKMRTLTPPHKLLVNLEEDGKYSNIILMPNPAHLYSLWLL